MQHRTLPQFLQRSRSTSTATRHCHACATPPAPAPPTPLSPNLRPRSKSATKPRPRSSSSSSSSKENREGPHSNPTSTNNNNNNVICIAKKSPVCSPRPCPSAWALSPGRSPEPRGMITESVEKEKKTKKKATGGVGGVMGLMLMRRPRKEVSAREEAAHRLRVMGCRLLQWRFVNARRERATDRVRVAAERKLFFAWLRINELRNIVAAKRILIQRRKHKLKLARVLNPQLHFLNQWDPLAKRHLESVMGLSRVLEAVCIPVPLIDGAQTDLVLLHDYTAMSMEIMVEIEAAVRLFYSKAEEVSTLLGELVETVGLEMKGLEELINTSKRITTLQMQETSLRANLIQAMKKEVEQPPLSTLRLQSWMKSNQYWHIY